MSSYLFLAEIAFLSSVFCVLHAFKLRIGLAPLYVLFGLFEAFLFFASRGSVPIHAEMLFGYEAFVAYILILPLMLGVMLIIYVHEGSSEARRFLVALIVLYVMHGILDGIFAYHAVNPPEGYAAMTAENPIIRYSTYQRFASLVAFLADAIALAATYQFLVNRFPRLPLVLPLFAAFVVAMTVDGMVFGGMQGDIVVTGADLLVVEKIQVGLAAGIPISIYLSWSVRRTTDEVEQGRVRKTFDILDLRRELESQKRQLEHVTDSFSRFVPPSVVEDIVEDPNRLELGGELRHVTVLFADIRGYSTLSEKLSPTETILLLNRYFEAVTGVIFEHGGMINEFEGDGILAVFGAPLELDHHEEAAVRAALGMLEAVEELNVVCDADGTSQIWKSVGLERFAIRIGLHSGDVVAGNIGTAQRIKYAVIGDTVNTAARVEALNKTLDTALLLSDATAKALRPGLVALQDLGAHQVKGKRDTVQVYTPA